MTLKNSKTILFAGLIAAMILPFSGMDYATAELIDEQKQQFIEQVQQLEKQISQTDDAEQKEILEAKLQNLLKEIFDSIPRSNTEFTKVKDSGKEVTTQFGGWLNEYISDIEVMELINRLRYGSSKNEHNLDS